MPLRNTLAVTHHSCQPNKLTTKALPARAYKTHSDLTSSIALVPAYPRVLGLPGRGFRRGLPLTGCAAHQIWLWIPLAPAPTQCNVPLNTPRTQHTSSCTTVGYNLSAPLGPFGTIFSTPPTHPNKPVTLSKQMPPSGPA